MNLSALSPSAKLLLWQPGDWNAFSAAARFSAVAEPAGGPRSGSDAVGPGTVLWSEAADGGWSAEVGGNPLERGDAFGWTNAFTATERGSVSIDFDGGARRIVMWLEVLAWLAVAVAWFRSRRRSDEGRS